MIHLLTLLFLFLGLFGERCRQSISWIMGFSCFHSRLLNSICSSYWDHVLMKSHLLELEIFVFRFIIEYR
jgi:hypothetical protein